MEVDPIGRIRFEPDEGISLSALYSRWPGISKGEMFSLIDNDTLTIYRPVKKTMAGILYRKAQDMFAGKDMALRVTNLHPDREDEIEMENSRVLLDTVRFIEAKCPDFLEPKAAETEEKEVDPDADALNEIISLTAKMSRREREMTLASVLLQNAERQQVENKTVAEPPSQGSAPKETEEPPLTPQQKASLARQEKTLEAWKPAIDAMVKVAVACGAEGPKLRQQPDFYQMFNEIDAELIDAQMEFFRTCLPDEHIDRTGGPRGKS